jgi:hypothetical protein
LPKEEEQTIALPKEEEQTISLPKEDEQTIWLPKEEEQRIPLPNKDKKTNNGSWNTTDNWRLNNTNLTKNRGELRNGMFTMGKLKSSHWNYILVYNNTSTVRPVICESWYFTHTWKAFALRGEVWVHKTSLTLLSFIVCTKPGKWLVMSLCVIVIHFVSFHEFEIVSTVWYFCFSFYYHK